MQENSEVNAGVPEDLRQKVSTLKRSDGLTLPEPSSTFLFYQNISASILLFTFQWNGENFGPLFFDLFAFIFCPKFCIYSVSSLDMSGVPSPRCPDHLRA